MELFIIFQVILIVVLLITSWNNYKLANKLNNCISSGEIKVVATPNLKKIKIEDYIRMAIDEVKEEDNITAVLLTATISYSEEQQIKFFQEMMRGEISEEEYLDLVKERNEQRLYLSYDNPEDSHSSMILDLDNFTENNPYLLYNQLYNSFKPHEGNHKELIEHKNGLKIAMKRKLGEHFADILTR